MKFVALVSGGKDSCYAITRCQASATTRLLSCCIGCCFSALKGFNMSHVGGTAPCLLFLLLRR